MVERPSIEEIEYRTRLANCEALELKVARERFELANKCGELCRIDAALGAFDGFLREFIHFLGSLPDAVQTCIPQTAPAQYKAIQTLIETQLKRLAEHRVHLAIESHTVQQKAATAEKNEKIARTAKRKKEAVK